MNKKHERRDYHKTTLSNRSPTAVLHLLLDRETREMIKDIGVDIHFKSGYIDFFCSEQENKPLDHQRVESMIRLGIHLLRALPDAITRGGAEQYLALGSLKKHPEVRSHRIKIFLIIGAVVGAVILVTLGIIIAISNLVG